LAIHSESALYSQGYRQDKSFIVMLISLKNASIQKMMA